MAFVDDDDAKAPEVRQVAFHTGDGQHSRHQPVPVDVVLPHLDQVLGTEDEGLGVVVILKDPGQRCGHQRLAKADYIAEKHPAALVEVMGGYLHGLSLKFEKRVAEVSRDGELADAGLRLARQVVGHLQIDVVRREHLLSRPALVDNAREFGADIDAETIVPAVFKPCLELEAGIVLEDVEVELALLNQAGHGEVAAADESGDRVVRVVPVVEVELGVECMAEEELDDKFAGLELVAEAAEGGFVTVGGSAEGKLLPKCFGHLRAQPRRLAIIDRVVALGEAQCAS